MDTEIPVQKQPSIMDELLDKTKAKRELYQSPPRAWVVVGRKRSAKAKQNRYEPVVSIVKGVRQLYDYDGTLNATALQAQGFIKVLEIFEHEQLRPLILAGHMILGKSPKMKQFVDDVKAGRPTRWDPEPETGPEILEGLIAVELSNREEPPLTPDSDSITTSKGLVLRASPEDDLMGAKEPDVEEAPNYTWNEFRSLHAGKTKEEISELWSDYKAAHKKDR